MLPVSAAPTHPLKHGVDVQKRFALQNGVRVLSENELLAAQGQRVHTGGSDPLNQRFADSFTAHFAALAQKYPVYGELRAIFDLSLAVTLAARTATSAGTLTAQRRPVPSAKSTVWWWDARE